MRPSETRPGARQDALSAADAQRRFDSGPRRIGEPPTGRDAAAPDKPAQRPSGYLYEPQPADDGEDRIKLAEGVELTRTELDDLRARAALEATRKLTLPADPNGYKAEMPPDFKLPPGVDFELNEKDPLMATYRQFAHEQGFDQATFSKGLGLVTMIRAQEAIEFQTAFDKEVGKLGAAAPARVDAAVQWLTSMGGPEAKALTDVFKMAPVAATVIAVENLMKRFSSQGITPYNAAHRADAPDDSRIPGYDKMTFEQKRDAQERRAGRR